MNKKTVLWTIFILYFLINVFLVVMHEPWRDEIHAWLMAKELSIPELIVESRFDGHPILWHLILMPFAKLGFPIITLNIISLIIMSVSVWFFLFKTNLPLVFKAFATFIPFTYVFSVISRNYCLIILLLCFISAVYKEKNNKPILYSVLIALLIHTHSLAWGIVAGLTLTFHFYEILLYFRRKNTTNIKKVLIGLTIIVVNTLLVVLELLGTSNINYVAKINSYIISVISIMLLIILLAFIFTLKRKSNYKEFIILLCGLGFQILIYTCVYSSVLIQRYMLVFAIFIFYLILLSYSNSKKNNYIWFIIFELFTLLFSIWEFITLIIADIQYPYSSSQEMAQYINENLPKDETILIDASVIGQSIIPYLNTAKFYDIGYEENVTCANVAFDYDKILNALNNINQSYSGRYLIICNNIVSLDYPVIYETHFSMTDEKFTLYYIPRPLGTY